MESLVFTVLVENSRENLFKVSQKYGLAAKQTIKASQELDKILNLLNHKSLEKQSS
ncbi:aspartyl-phosphate phosphatase Spo0E family protein [Peribacillus acanthi]|uniref:aspartyl-phosphate phosphatase Spo0E family protein n=1 Tax=Peribacillus acanthi TaxID=2171554 RepID=UPI000D3E670E|nr:aspartyl-phosphate phosphatase Spo0E family protein [Peribacillus acanthi]